MEYDVLVDYPALATFLSIETAATVAVPIDHQGTIHAASLIYWHNPVNLYFYFVTNRNSEKCRLLQEFKAIKGACVVGTYKGTAFTLQMRGSFRIADKTDSAAVIKSYYEKRHNHGDDMQDPDNILLEFKPTWGRYTDYSKGYEQTMLHLAKGLV